MGSSAMHVKMSGVFWCCASVCGVRATECCSEESREKSLVEDSVKERRGERRPTSFVHLPSKQTACKNTQES